MNVGHLIGLALLFGAIVPLDLRVLGVWHSVPMGVLYRPLRTTAIAGLTLALVCGALLFLARPLDYIDSTLFRLKLGGVLLGIINALLAYRIWQTGKSGDAWMKLTACVSLASWLLVIVCGRLVGYR